MAVLLVSGTPGLLVDDAGILCGARSGTDARSVTIPVYLIAHAPGKEIVNALSQRGVRVGLQRLPPRGLINALPWHSSLPRNDSKLVQLDWPDLFSDEKTLEALGVELDTPKSGAAGFPIIYVKPGGQADGKLSVGAVITEINSHSLIGLNMTAVAQLVLQPGVAVQLKLRSGTTTRKPSSLGGNKGGGDPKIGFEAYRFTKFHVASEARIKILENLFQYLKYFSVLKTDENRHSRRNAYEGINSLTLISLIVLFYSFLTQYIKSSF